MGHDEVVICTQRGIFMPQNMQYVDGRMELSYEDTKCDKMYHFCWQN